MSIISATADCALKDKD